MSGGLLDITLFNDDPSDFVLEHGFDLLLDSKLANMATLLLTVHLLDLLFLGSGLSITYFLLEVEQFLFVNLLLLTDTCLDQLMGVLSDLII